jgi:phospholipid-binding lipoprotein MlaA
MPADKSSDRRMISDRRQKRPSPLVGAAAALAVVALASGCASTPQDPEAAAVRAELDDPLEPLNRYVFDVNDGLDILLLRPVADIYRGVVPEPIRTSVRSFLRNLRSPIDFANEVLQGDVEGAETAAARFLVNTTIGFAGLADVAAEAGLPYTEEDFGQTLAVWGVAPGPYLVLPVLGPSNVRDTAGYAVDSLADPVNIYLRNNDASWLVFTRLGVTAVDNRSRTIELVDDLRANSIDYYAAVRSLYRQNRANQINDGAAAPGADEFPDFEERAPAVDTAPRNPTSR